MKRSSLINIAALVSLMLFMLGVGDWFFAQHAAINWTTHGAMMVEHRLICDGNDIQLDNEDKLSPAQFTAALIRLDAATRFSWPPGSVEVEGWGFPGYRRDYGIFATETFTLTIDPSSVSSHADSGVVCGSWRRVVVPIAVPIVLASILPIIMGGRIVRGRLPRRPGLCQKCRYNLTGNTSGVCPECGQAIVGENAA